MATSTRTLLPWEALASAEAVSKAGSCLLSTTNRISSCPPATIFNSVSPQGKCEALTALLRFWGSLGKHKHQIAMHWEGELLSLRSFPWRAQVCWWDLGAVSNAWLHCGRRWWDQAKLFKKAVLSLGHQVVRKRESRIMRHDKVTLFPANSSPLMNTGVQVLLKISAGCFPDLPRWAGRILIWRSVLTILL